MSHGVFSPGKWLEFTSLVHSGGVKAQPPVQNNPTQKNNAEPPEETPEKPSAESVAKARNYVKKMNVPQRGCSLFRK